MHESVSKTGILLTRHDYEETLAEAISVVEIREAILNSIVVEDYADDLPVGLIS